jgi:hypothetical protein
MDLGELLLADVAVLRFLCMVLGGLFLYGPRRQWSENIGACEDGLASQRSDPGFVEGVVDSLSSFAFGGGLPSAAGRGVVFDDSCDRAMEAFADIRGDISQDLVIGGDGL